jgi:UDP-4-amino-4-deoxy-L-arabinose-oxoglutarate aminotransferase
MNETFLPFCRPNVTEDDIAAVTQVLRSGWITTGPQTAKLEQMFCDLTGAGHAVSANSATALLHLYLVATGIGPGDEVITPSLTWVSTVNVITLMGATPVFVDVDRDHLMVSAELIEQAITAKTKLIIPVHFAGAPLDIDPIRAVAKKHGIPVLEDAAHALGSTCRGIPAGAGGDAIFSLQAIKNVTSAEGGMLVTDNAELAARIRRLRFHGLGVDAYDRQTHGRNPQAEVMEPGFKYNLPDICSALAVSQFGRLDEINAKRTLLAQRYREQFRGVAGLQPLSAPDWPHQHCWHLFVVRILKDNGSGENNPDARNQFIEGMKAKNIGCGIHFRAVHEQKYYREAFDKQGLAGSALNLPNTEWNSARICSLPLFPDMTVADVDRVVTAAREVLLSL